MTTIQSCDRLAYVHADVLSGLLSSLPHLVGADLLNARVTAISLASDVLHALADAQALEAARVVPSFGLIGHFYSPIEYPGGQALKYQGGVTAQNHHYLCEKFPGGVLLNEYRGDRIKADGHGAYDGGAAASVRQQTARTNCFPA